MNQATVRLTAEFRCLRQPPIVCINGDAYIETSPVRLYEMGGA